LNCSFFGQAVLSVLRKDIDNWQKDWEGFELELKRVFMEEEEDNRQLERRRELGTLLQVCCVLYHDVHVNWYL
jgi:hypothetical protein